MMTDGMIPWNELHRFRHRSGLVRSQLTDDGPIDINSSDEKNSHSKSACPSCSQSIDYVLSKVQYDCACLIGIRNDRSPGTSSVDCYTTFSFDY